MTDQVKEYEATQARFIGGQHRAVGDPVKMTERAAKYYMEPNGSGLKLATSAAVTPERAVEAKPTAKAKQAPETKD